MKKFAEKENITEELKATNQLEWVQKMNNIKNSVEEIILRSYIYNQICSLKSFKNKSRII